MEEIIIAEDAQNEEPKCHVVLCLDVSGSMSGTRINQLNAGVQEMLRFIKKDELATLRVELSIITFGSTAQVICEANTIDFYSHEPLVTSGNTAMGAGLELALTLIEKRKAYYKKTFQHYFRPILVMITDGGPTDGMKYKAMGNQIYKLELEKGLTFFAIGTEGAKKEVLEQVSKFRPPLPVSNKDFKELFQWLSASVSAVSHSNPGGTDLIKLPPTNKFQGSWDEM